MKIKSNSSVSFFIYFRRYRDLHCCHIWGGEGQNNTLDLWKKLRGQVLPLAQPHSNVTGDNHYSMINVYNLIT